MEEYSLNETSQTHDIKQEPERNETQKRSRDSRSQIAQFAREGVELSELPNEDLLEIAKLVGNLNMTELMFPSLQIETGTFGGEDLRSTGEMAENRIESMPISVHSPEMPVDSVNLTRPFPANRIGNIAGFVSGSSPSLGEVGYGSVHG